MVGIMFFPPCDKYKIRTGRVSPWNSKLLSQTIFSFSNLRNSSIFWGTIEVAQSVKYLLSMHKDMSFNLPEPIYEPSMAGNTCNSSAPTVKWEAGTE